MKTIKRLVLLVLALSASPIWAETSNGKILSTETQDKVQIVMTGEAAEKLYQALLQAAEARQLPCRDGFSVRLDPVVCVNDGQNIVRCYLGFDKEAAKFFDSSACDSPDPSIIGVGNIRFGHDPR